MSEGHPFVCNLGFGICNFQKEKTLIPGWNQENEGLGISATSLYIGMTEKNLHLLKFSEKSSIV
jgi:hypothetical protein